MNQSRLAATVKIVRQLLVVFVVIALIALIAQFIGGQIEMQRNREEARQEQQAQLEADQIFGQLSLPPLSKLPVNNLETINYAEGIVLSDENNLENIYQIEPHTITFTSEDIGLNIAANLGFESSPQREDNSLIWSDVDQQLTYDKLRQEVQYQNLAASSKSETPGNSPSDDIIDTDQLASQAINILENLRIPLRDISPATAEYNFLRRTGSSFSGVSNPAQAQFIEIKMWHTAENYQEQEMIVRYDDYRKAALEIIIAANDQSQEGIYYLKTRNIKLAEEIGRYEILSPQAAWQNVIAGEGAFKQILKTGQNEYNFGQLSGRNIDDIQVDPDQVQLAYLNGAAIGPEYNYLYPIYIFSGPADIDNAGIANGEYILYTHALQSQVGLR